MTICPWWDGAETRAEVERQLVQDAERGQRPWIWICHAPPEGSPVSWTGRKSAGDEFLTAWIARFAPDVVLSGHIHNAPFYAPTVRGGPCWLCRRGIRRGLSW